MIAIIGLLTVGIMIGLAMSDHNTSNMEYVNSLAAWAQVITGGCTLYLAYLGFTQWKIQLHYPKYIDEISKAYDAFHTWHSTVSEFYWWAQDEVRAEKPNYDRYFSAQRAYFSLLMKNDLLFKKFISKENFEMIDATSLQSKLSKTRLIFEMEKGVMLHDAYLEHLKLHEIYKKAIH